MRYVVAVVWLILLLPNLYMMIVMPDALNNNCTCLVDAGLISYLVAYKPSNTSLWRKILKFLGYTLVFLSLLVLGFHSKYFEYPAYMFVMFIVGVIVLVYGHRMDGTEDANVGEQDTIIRDMIVQFFENHKKNGISMENTYQELRYGMGGNDIKELAKSKNLDYTKILDEEFEKMNIHPKA